MEYIRKTYILEDKYSEGVFRLRIDAEGENLLTRSIFLNGKYSKEKQMVEYTLAQMQGKDFIDVTQLKTNDSEVCG